jgi:hypothetical protein
MSNPSLKSPQIAAQDLLLEDIHGMSLDELEEHVENLRQAVLALADLNTRPDWISYLTRLDIRRLIAKLEARIEEVLALIQDWKVEAAQAANEDERGEKAKGARRVSGP